MCVSGWTGLSPFILPSNGSDEISWIVKDNGGTANGGLDTLSQTFTINVTAVNDAPHESR